MHQSGKPLRRLGPGVCRASRLRVQRWKSLEIESPIGPWRLRASPRHRALMLFDLHREAIDLVESESASGHLGLGKPRLPVTGWGGRGSRPVGDDSICDLVEPRLARSSPRVGPRPQPGVWAGRRSRVGANRFVQRHQQAVAAESPKRRREACRGGRDAAALGSPARRGPSSLDRRSPDA